MFEGMAVWLAKFFMYGCIGLLIEVFFTSFHSLFFQKNMRAIGTTYLWMLPIYGGGAMLFGWIHNVSPLPLWANALLYVPLIFFIEFSSGWAYMKIFSRKLWDYGNARWGIMGLIRVDYAGYWLSAALFFEYSNNALGAALLRFIEVTTS